MSNELESIRGNWTDAGSETWIVQIGDIRTNGGAIPNGVNFKIIGDVITKMEYVSLYGHIPEKSQ